MPSPAHPRRSGIRCHGVLAACLAATVLAGCGGGNGEAPVTQEEEAVRPAVDGGLLPAGAGQEPAPPPQWQRPDLDVDPAQTEALRLQAAQALEAGELLDPQAGAIALYLALDELVPGDGEAATGLAQALDALAARLDASLQALDRDPAALEPAQQAGAVLAEMRPDDEATRALLERLEQARLSHHQSALGERALATGGVALEGAIPAEGRFRRALELRPGDARALQGLAAVESALIREAEGAAREDRYALAGQWLDRAAKVRPDAGTVEDARQRLVAHRSARIRGLRASGIAALADPEGIEEARRDLEVMLRIAPEGEPAVTELRERIELATHYGLFRPGQSFTEALSSGGRGPEMVVIPHGAFRMGAPAGEAGSGDAERPVREVRFDRGLAVSRTEVTVGEFRRFINATGYRTRAVRRGYSVVYDERSGNMVRRSGVDWSSDYVGEPASDDLPVVHVSAQDAVAYAEWLAGQTGRNYRLPSEAEFEYMLRAGSNSSFPWGDGAPPPDSGNFTGGGDRSPGGREWRNAFDGYSDDAWGPAPVASYAPNAFGLHDLAGNVSEWVADCWHDSYRRAPSDGRAWINPGCRDKVVRGGSWASSPAQTRSAWRLGSPTTTTNARVGFRVVREI